MIQPNFVNKIFNGSQPNNLEIGLLINDSESCAIAIKIQIQIQIQVTLWGIEQPLASLVTCTAVTWNKCSYCMQSWRFSSSSPTMVSVLLSWHFFFPSCFECVPAKHKKTKIIRWMRHGNSYFFLSCVLEWEIVDSYLWKIIAAVVRDLEGPSH